MNLDELYLPSSQRNRELLYHATSVRNAFSVIYYNTLDDGTKQEFTNISWNNRYHKWGRDGGGVYGVNSTVVLLSLHRLILLFSVSTSRF